MKILLVGSGSILSKAILLQHSTDEVHLLYHKKPTEQSPNQFPISDLKNLKSDYDIIYIVSAIISNNPEDCTSIYHVNVQLVHLISQQFPKAKLVYFSTVSVYDGLTEGEINETTLPSPESIYGISKLWAEKLVSQHPKFCILRIASMYGIGMKNTTFLPKIIDDALTKKQITLLGNGARKQNYIHANDVARLAKNLALLGENMIQLAISQENFTNTQIAEIIQKYTNCTIGFQGIDETRSVAYHQNTYPFSEYNMTTLENGIKELIEWKRKQF